MKRHDAAKSRFLHWSSRCLTEHSVQLVQGPELLRSGPGSEWNLWNGNNTTGKEQQSNKWNQIVDINRLADLISSNHLESFPQGLNAASCLLVVFLCYPAQSSLCSHRNGPRQTEITEPSTSIDQVLTASHRFSQVLTGSRRDSS